MQNVLAGPKGVLEFPTENALVQWANEHSLEGPFDIDAGAEKHGQVFVSVMACVCGKCDNVFLNTVVRLDDNGAGPLPANLMLSRTAWRQAVKTLKPLVEGN